ncbi:MAG: response regulator [Thermoplasmatota archaeon]
MVTARALIVDDEPAIRTVTAELLARLAVANMIVDDAASGEEALEKLEANEYDLVLSDYRMARITGAELLGEVLKRQPDALRVLVTGYQEPDIAEEAIGTARAHLFVQKPWSPREFLPKLEQLLAEKLASRASALPRVAAAATDTLPV